MALQHQPEALTPERFIASLRAWNGAVRLLVLEAEAAVQTDAIPDETRKGLPAPSR